MSLLILPRICLNPPFEVNFASVISLRVPTELDLLKIVHSDSVLGWQISGARFLRSAHSSLMNIAGKVCSNPVEKSLEGVSSVINKKEEI